MMAEDALVDGDAGFVSDESSFCGDEATKSNLERQARRRLRIPYDPFIKKIEAEETPTTKRTKLESKAESKKELNVADFLKSRPQIAKLEESAANDREDTKTRAGRTRNGKEAADILHTERFKDDPAAWQQSETIDSFLKRLPVANPTTATVGPWLWVERPEIGENQRERNEMEQVDAFIETGKELLEGFLQRKSEIEAQNTDKAAATITRKMGPYRDKLEQDLLHAAVENGTTCGKWMLFPGLSDLPRYWRLVAEATSQGKLGPVSKVATYDPYDGKPETLICVYTYDFTDLNDVRRVLESLYDLELCTKGGRPIYYKCDAYTYLGLSSDNSYKLRASLLSSKELFENEAKVSKDGPIARMKKRHQTIDGFLF